MSGKLNVSKDTEIKFTYNGKPAKGTVFASDYVKGNWPYPNSVKVIVTTKTNVPEEASLIIDGVPGDCGGGMTFPHPKGYHVLFYVPFAEVDLGTVMRR